MQTAYDKLVQAVSHVTWGSAMWHSFPRGMHYVHTTCLTCGRQWITVEWRLLFSRGRDHPKDLGVDGKIILEWILRKQSGKVWTGWLWL